MILVFAGAGASTAVNPEKYATTVEFFQRLPENVTGNKLFRFAVTYLREHEGMKDTIDIEQVLWVMNDLRGFASDAANPSTVTGWFMQNNRLGEIANLGGDVRATIDISKRAIEVIDSLSSLINTHVYALYGDSPTEAELETNWMPFLMGLMGYSQRLEIVTTNYDIVLEQVISLIKAPVHTGRSMTVYSTLNTSIWDIQNLNEESTSGLLTKLHGSVDWDREGGQVFVGNPTFKGKHERHAIIYPGFKGTPNDELFKKLHDYFQKTLSLADIIIFIGFAFRDKYINEILRSNLRPNAQVIVLNPAEHLPNFPLPENQLLHIKKPFNLEGCNEVLANVQR